MKTEEVEVEQVVSKEKEDLYQELQHLKSLAPAAKQLVQIDGDSVSFYDETQAQMQKYLSARKND